MALDKSRKDEVQEALEMELEGTGDEHASEPELEDVEEQSTDKIKQLRAKLKESEEARAAQLEELQRVKADFLNARKRLEEERKADRTRSTITHVEGLLPLCDSFEMAMADREAWEAAPEKWRRGVEGINAQLQALLSTYGVASTAPVTGADFDPEHHEAVGNEQVEDPTMHHKVVKTVQRGYSIDVHGTKRQVRPARVIVGEYTEG